MCQRTLLGCERIVFLRQRHREDSCNSNLRGRSLTGRFEVIAFRHSASAFDQMNDGVGPLPIAALRKCAQYRRKKGRWRFSVMKIFLAVACGLFIFASLLTAQPQTKIEKQKSTGCQARREAIPLTLRDNVGLITIHINGGLKTFLVDPAGRTIINSDRLKLPQVRQVRAGVIGASGVMPLDWDIVSVEQLSLGSTELHHLEVLARTLEPLERHVGQRLDGILGTDLLTVWSSVSMDFQHGKLVLEQRSQCKEGQPRDASNRNEDHHAPPWTYDALHSREKISLRP